MSLKIRYKECSEQTACNDFVDVFQIKKPKFNSITSQYELYCEKQWTKSMIMNICLFVSGIFTILTHILADKYGRRTILLFGSPLGIVGSFIGYFSNNLILIAIANTLTAICDGTIFSMNFIYLNETLVDPLRSKSSGLKTFSLSIGSLGILK